MIFLFFHFGLFFWTLALIAWILFPPIIASGMAMLSTGSFLLHIIKRKPLLMFIKKIKHGKVDNSESIDITKSSVIAQGVIFEGNIITSGQMLIYGQVKGNIHTVDGLITIKREGIVIGNITCPTLKVDGSIEGECCAQVVEICEHGRVEGTLSYVALKVAEGGVLAGKAQHCVEINPSNIVDFTNDQEKFN